MIFSSGIKRSSDGVHLPNSSSPLPPNPPTSTSTPSFCKSEGKSPLVNMEPVLVSGNTNGVSLDGIVREYLTNQHALCQNPVVTCPTFDLFRWVLYWFYS